jgi:hypothetical protein
MKTLTITVSDKFAASATFVAKFFERPMDDLGETIENFVGDHLKSLATNDDDALDGECCARIWSDEACCQRVAARLRRIVGKKVAIEVYEDRGEWRIQSLPAGSERHKLWLHCREHGLSFDEEDQKLFSRVWTAHTETAAA